MSTTKSPVIEIEMDKIEELLGRLDGNLAAEDLQLLHDLLDSHRYITDLIGDQSTTIARLRKMLFGASTEKSKKVLGEKPKPESSSTPDPGPDPDSRPGPGPDPAPAPAPAAEEAREPAKGHGRNGADDYPAAERVPVRHTCLKPGDPCPVCDRGKLYPKEPKRLLRIVGQPPVGGRIFELERLRCNLCGRLFVAEAPEGIGDKKYDESVAAVIGLLKYGTGLPFYRLCCVASPQASVVAPKMARKVCGSAFRSGCAPMVGTRNAGKDGR